MLILFLFAADVLFLIFQHYCGEMIMLMLAKS